MRPLWKWHILAAGMTIAASGCWSHIDALPWMDIPPYRDPPPGFSSTYHRALYGPRFRRASPEPGGPIDSAQRGTPRTAEQGGVRQLQHTTPARPPANTVPQPPAVATGAESPQKDDAETATEPMKRTPFRATYDFLMRPAEPLRF
jgi:hypothetical protein